MEIRRRHQLDQRRQAPRRHPRSEGRFARVRRAGLLIALAACKRHEIAEHDAAPIAIDARPLDAPVAIDAAPAARPLADRVAVGATSACAVMTDKTVRCWGGKLPAAPSVRGVVDLQLAGDTACALLADASVSCWGRIAWGDRPGETAAPAGILGVKGIKQLFVGPRSACGREDDGSLVCWGGIDPSGRAVAGAAEAHHYPTPRGDTPKGFAALAATAVEIADADGLTCARTADGKVRCVGEPPDCMKPAKAAAPKPPAPPPPAKVARGKKKPPARKPPPPPPAPKADEPVDFALALPPAMHLALAHGPCVVTRAGALACVAGCAPASKDFASLAPPKDATSVDIDPASGRGCAITGVDRQVSCWEPGARAAQPVAD